MHAWPAEEQQQILSGKGSLVPDSPQASAAPPPPPPPESDSGESTPNVDSEVCEEELAEEEALKPGAPVVPLIDTVVTPFQFTRVDFNVRGVSILDRQRTMAVSRELNGA